MSPGNGEALPEHKAELGIWRALVSCLQGQGALQRSVSLEGQQDLEA